MNNDNENDYNISTETDSVDTPPEVEKELEVEKEVETLNELYSYSCLIETLKRWFTCLGCLTSRYFPTHGEEQMLSSKLSPFNKKYLVHRKSRLLYVCIFTFCTTMALLSDNIKIVKETKIPPRRQTSNSFNQTNLLTSYSSIYSNATNDDYYSAEHTQDIVESYAEYYSSRVNIGFAVIRLLVCLLLLAARLLWNHYKISSKLVISGLCFQIILQMFVYFVPYRDLVIGDDNHLSLGEQASIFLYLFYWTKDFIYTIILLPQNMISNASALANAYPKNPEFKIASVAVNIVYVPMVIVIFGLLFQILSAYEAIAAGDLDEAPYDWRVFGLMLSYIGTLVIPFAIISQSDRKKQMIGLGLHYSSLLVTLILGIACFGDFISIPDIFSIIVNGYTASLFNQVAIRDALICAVASFSVSEDDESPHNLYSEVDNGTSLFFQSKKTSTTDSSGLGQNDTENPMRDSIIGSDNPMRDNSVIEVEMSRNVGFRN